jgi:hypothetical protein
MKTDDCKSNLNPYDVLFSKSKSIVLICLFVVVYEAE